MRSKLRTWIIFGLTTIFFLGCRSEASRTEIMLEQQKPNVLFIAVDDLRPELNFYGKSHIISPNLDKLASQSLVFERAYCQVPVCGASRASLLTGLRPTRDRFLAGAFIPHSWYLQAQRFRRWFQQQVQAIFQQVDVLIAPTTPCVAPFIEQQTMAIAGETVLVRPHLGLYTQPLSFIGLPVLSVPVVQSDSLPIGVQIIAAPYQESAILRVAHWLETQGVIAPFPYPS